MSESFYMVAEPASAQIAEKKSRFIAYAAPANSEEEAQAFIEQIRIKHRDARHNVYAYIIGESAQIKRSSDDGEPAGTAGRPTLEAIENCELKNTVVVVTRYFGGILLGTGGLTRAYGQAASLALQEAPRVKKTAACTYQITFEYPQVGKVEAWLARQGYEIKQKLFNEVIAFIIMVPMGEETSAHAQLTELTQGRAEWFDLCEQGYIINK